MAEGVNFIKKIGDIPIFNDVYMEPDSYLVMYKGEEGNSGYVWVPTEIWNEGMKTAKGAPIEEKEINEILRKKGNRKFSDIKAVICNAQNPEAIEKVIESLYKKFE